MSDFSIIYLVIDMGTFPVDDSQLALYLAFTFLSLAVSIVAYCAYNHLFKLGDPDYADYVQVFAKVSKTNENSTDRLRIEAPLID